MTRIDEIDLFVLKGRESFVEETEILVYRGKGTWENERKRKEVI